MHSLPRFEGIYVPVPIPFSDDGSLDPDAHDQRTQNETVWTDLQNDEFEAAN